MTVAAIGVILVMIEKVGAFTNPSLTRINEIADNVAREAMRRDGLLLAQLLSTDELDSRAARGNFQPGKSSRMQKTKGKPSRSAVREFAEIVDFYLKETRGRMVILGAPGTGKTVLAVSLTVGLLKQRPAASTANGHIIPIPCLLYLPSWEPTTHDLTDWLEMQVVDRFRLGRKVAARLVRDGWILPVLDGLDEMDSQDSSMHRSERSVTRINDYIARTPESKIVVVCRSGANYYERLARRVRDADEITVQRLKPEQIIDYIKTQCPDELSLSAWQPVFDAVKSRDSNLIRSALDTPWRLTAAVTLTLYGGDPATLLPAPTEKARPGSRVEYLDRIGKLLMETFITARIAIHRKRGFDADLTIRRLCIVADLLTQMEIAGKGGREIILHQWWKAFDERKIIGRQLFILWVVMHWPFGILGFLPISSTGSGGGWSLGLAILSNYGTIIIGSSYLAARRSGPINLQVGSLRAPRRAYGVAVSIAFSAFTGIVAALAYGIPYGFGMAATTAAFMILFTASTGLDPTDATRPTAILINDRNFAVVIGIAIGACATLYYVTLYGLALAITFASMCFLGSIFSSWYMRYLVTAYYGGTRGLPFRFANFMSWCHSAGILRISGIGYQFRHQELLDYLTNR